MTENFIFRTWQTTPPLTKSIAVLCCLISLLVYIKAISPFYLSYSTFYLKKLQIWRLLTCFFYFGPLNIDTALHIIFLCRYSRMLEDGFLHTSDYFYMLSIVMTLLFTASLYLKVTVLGSCLSSTITYVWTRKNPNTHVQLLGCVIFPAFYLPFIVPLFTFISEKKIPVEEAMGIIVGHLYYYFKFVYPRFGKDILKTPRILKRLFGEIEKKKEEKRLK
ncbi:hypothetical protein GVAV_001815 [Gurleya vavrai]